ncbi:MAG: cofactor-independent phosphoglycerate mutase [bacterium]
MKYIFLVGDGMADYPIEQLGNKTPLEVANTPNMDTIATEGISGTVRTIPDELASGSGVANLNILGYDPRKYYTGRGPFEALNMGVDLTQGDIAFRCNLVTVADGIMVDYSAGHISDSEAKDLIEFIDKSLATGRPEREFIEFYSGTSYRHLMVVREKAETQYSGFTMSDLSKVQCIPPHDITGKECEKNFPAGKGAELLLHLMVNSIAMLQEHDINKARIADGKNPANMIWLWGQGRRPAMTSFAEKFGVKGSIISAVNLIKGIGLCAGLKVINVKGATGFLDTNYKGKAEAALKSLNDGDFVFVHVEAPDEAGHMGLVDKKIQAIEDFDRLVVGTVLEGAKALGNCRIAVLPDHPTPISTKTHSREAVPFAICGEGIEPDGVSSYSESAAKGGSVHFDQGHMLMDYFIKKNSGG